MQKKLSSGKLLNEQGHLLQAGYSTDMVRRYDRDQIKASKMRIKEWDYYLVYNTKFAIALTVADNGYMGMLSASVIDFENKKEKTSSIIELLTMGKYKMPETSKKGDVVVKNNQGSFSFIHEKEKRHLIVEYPKFDGEKSLRVNLVLEDEPQENIVIATPFKDKPKAFYYNQKIVGFRAHGEVIYGEDELHFDKLDTQAILDWGRGVWTYKNTWYWSSLASEVDGHKIGFNLGYGFGDTSSASENMVFYDGFATKLNNVQFFIPKDRKGNNEYLQPWKITSDDGSLELTFAPILNRHSDINLVVLRSNQNQVFGKFSGTIKLKDGKVVTLREQIGFAECVFNKW